MSSEQRARTDTCHLLDYGGCITSPTFQKEMTTFAPLRPATLHLRSPKTLNATLLFSGFQANRVFPQVLSTQRNVAANGQRKSVATFAVAGSWDGSQQLRPSFPVELKDVLLLSVSPTGAQNGVLGPSIHYFTGICT